MAFYIIFYASFSMSQRWVQPKQTSARQHIARELIHDAEAPRLRVNLMTAFVA